MKTEEVLIVAGVGFAVWWLARESFRAGRMLRFGNALQFDWHGLGKALAEDESIFAEGSNDTPGVFANLGGVEGRAYTMIDGEPYYLTSGR